jgi:N-methylhydantoinase A
MLASAESSRRFNLDGEGRQADRNHNGGTLTDLVVLDGERVYHTKTLRIPYDLSKCFVDGLRQISAEIYGEPRLDELLQTTDHIRYSTTQGTNALVQHKARVLDWWFGSGT